MNDRFHKGTDLGSISKENVPTPTQRESLRDISKNHENKPVVENDEDSTNPMKRRTFLWFVPVALSIPILLELIRHRDSNSTALGVASSTAESISKIPSSTDSQSGSETKADNGFGLTLAEARRTVALPTVLILFTVPMRFSILLRSLWNLIQNLLHFWIIISSLLIRNV